MVPYLVGGAVNTLAGIFNPDSPLLVLTSAAAASFGGTICLFWAGFTAGMSTPNIPTDAPTSRAVNMVTRSWGWVGLGAAAVLVYFLVLGPGIPRG